MGKKVLVAVGNCAYSEQAVKYCARSSSAAKDVTYTLFNVQPLLPTILIEKAEADPEVKAEVDELVREEREASESLVDKLKDLMVREGIPDNRIETVTEPMQMGMAKDILNRAEQGDYDAIVLGRRGLTPARDCFLGATATKVVEHALEIPVWLVSGEAVSMKVLLAVDGSESSFRILDHLVDMVGPNPDLRLTLFHVQSHLKHCRSVLATGRPYEIAKEKPRLQEILEREDSRCMEEFYEKARQKLETAGLKKNQIEIKNTTWSYDISTAILDEAASQQHGTLMVGRRGKRPAFFAGSIAMRLLQKTSEQTLCVVS